MRSSLACALAFAALPAATVLAAPPSAAVADSSQVIEAETRPGTAAEEDASIDRGFALPTAMTQPARTFTVNDYEIFAVGMTYAFTDSIQLSLTVVPVPFLGTALIANAKWQVLNAGRWHLALEGGYSTGAVVIGSAASLCLSADCHSLLNTNVLVAPGASDKAAVLYDASWIQRIAPSVKTVVEITSGGWLGSKDAFSAARSAIVWGGLRPFSRHVTGDVGLAMGIGDDFGSNVIPFGSLSVRF